MFFSFSDEKKRKMLIGIKAKLGTSAQRGRMYGKKTLLSESQLRIQLPYYFTKKVRVIIFNVFKVIDFFIHHELFPFCRFIHRK